MKTAQQPDSGQEQEALTYAEKTQWSSETAFVASMAAAAVGLGNLWRFPYIMGENGGGAFVVAFLISLVVVVMPIMILEVAAGRLSKGSTVETYRQVNKFGAYYGWFVILITVGITSYYLVITGWTLGYSVDAVRGDVRRFGEFSAGYNSLWYFLVICALAGGILLRGVKAIETLSKFLIPILLMVIIGLVIAASRTSGWEEATAFFFNVDWTRLQDNRIWAFAFGQAFYTLAIGQGYLVTYGSYIPRKTHVPRACITVAVVETSVAMLAGFMIFPFVFSLGMQPDEGSELAFEIMPQVFENMAGGGWLAILFFSLFFMAAFSSCLAGLKVITSAVAQEMKLSNIKAVGLVTLAMLVLGLGSALSFTPIELTIGDTPVLNFVDQLIGGNVLIFSGVAGAALFCWFLPPLKIRSVLGTSQRWWEWRIYLVGRYLPFLLLFWIILSWGAQLLRG